MDERENNPKGARSPRTGRKPILYSQETFRKGREGNSKEGGGTVTRFEEAWD